MNGEEEIMRHIQSLGKSLDKESILLGDGRPNRNTIIGNDEIVDLKILLETETDWESLLFNL